MSDHQYLLQRAQRQAIMAYPVTVDSVEEWLVVLSTLIEYQNAAPDDYQGRHESKEI